jgi:hypothetical protein
MQKMPHAEVSKAVKKEIKNTSPVLTFASPISEEYDS